MKCLALLFASALVLLSACASDHPDGQQTVAERSYTPIGTNIPRKNGTPADGGSVVDKQALENDRIMNSGNLGGK